MCSGLRTRVMRCRRHGRLMGSFWHSPGCDIMGQALRARHDIYLMDVASKQWVQLTHDGGRNDFPSWSPDGRHIVFQSSRSGGEQIWKMLADGSNQKQLTVTGSNTQPNWSWK